MGKSSVVIDRSKVFLSLENYKLMGVINKEYLYIDFPFDNYNDSEDAFNCVIFYKDQHLEDTSLSEVSVHKDKVRLIFNTIEFESDKDIVFIERVIEYLEDQKLFINKNKIARSQEHVKNTTARLIILIIMNLVLGLIYSGVIFGKRYDMYNKKLLPGSLLLFNVMILGQVYIINMFMFKRFKLDFQREKQGQGRNAAVIFLLVNVYMLTFGFFFIITMGSFLDKQWIPFTISGFMNAYNIVDQLDYTGRILGDYWMLILCYIIIIGVSYTILYVISKLTLKTHTFKIHTEQ